MVTFSTMHKLETVILLGDFNPEITENAMKEFCDTYSLKNLVAEAGESEFNSPNSDKSNQKLPKYHYFGEWPI